MSLRGEFLLILLCWTAVCNGKDVDAAKRDTTISNVQAVYNRFTRTSTGKATYYGKYPGGGACALDPLSPMANQPSWIQIAVGQDDYQGSLGCGMCVEIYGTGKPAAPDLGGTTPVTGDLKGIVHDLCGSCQQGDVDLYVPGNGVWGIKLKAIDCPTVQGSAGYIQLRFTGSNEWYFKLQARNAKIPVAGMEVFNTVTGDWYCLKRTDDNYFASDGLGKVTFPMKLRLTSITNEQLETTVTTLKNDESFPSDVQFSGFKTRGGSPEGIKCFGQGNKESSEATPEEDEKFCAGKSDGTYADPKDCSAFYECSNGKSFKKYCPNGLKFNAMIKSCDDPMNVNCVENHKDSEADNDMTEKDDTVRLSNRKVSPRSTDGFGRNRKRRSVETRGRNTHNRGRTSHLIKKHHHYHRHQRSHKAHRGVKRKVLGSRIHGYRHDKGLHARTMESKNHHRSKESADKRVNVKVKIQFTGSNHLSGTLVSKNPDDPKEGNLTVSAVENAEKGDENIVENKPNGASIGNENMLKALIKGGMSTTGGEEDVSAVVQDMTNPISYGADGKVLKMVLTGLKGKNPFNIGAVPQPNVGTIDGISDTADNKVAGTLVVEANRMEDGTVHTTTTLRPDYNTKNQGSLLDNEGHEVESTVEKQQERPKGFQLIKSEQTNGQQFFPMNSVPQMHSSGSQIGPKYGPISNLLQTIKNGQNGQLQEKTNTASGGANAESLQSTVPSQQVSSIGKGEVKGHESGGESSQHNVNVTIGEHGELKPILTEVGAPIPSDPNGKNLQSSNGNTMQNSTETGGGTNKVVMVQPALSPNPKVQHAKVNSNHEGAKTAAIPSEQGKEVNLNSSYGARANSTFQTAGPIAITNLTIISVPTNSENASMTLVGVGSTIITRLQSTQEKMDNKGDYSGASDGDKQNGNNVDLTSQTLPQSINKIKQVRKGNNSIAGSSTTGGPSEPLKSTTDLSNQLQVLEGGKKISKQGPNTDKEAITNGETNSIAKVNPNSDTMKTVAESSNKTGDQLAKAPMELGLKETQSTNGVENKGNSHNVPEQLNNSSGGKVPVSKQMENLQNIKPPTLGQDLNTAAVTSKQGNGDKGMEPGNRVHKVYIVQNLHVAGPAGNSTEHEKGAIEGVGKSDDKKGVEAPIEYAPVIRIRLKRPSNALTGIKNAPGNEKNKSPDLDQRTHLGPLINLSDMQDVDQARQPLHSSTGFIRELNRDDHDKYEDQETVPVRGSETYDAYGNHKGSMPTISENEAHSLLEGDNEFLDNIAVQNVLYNPALNSERHEDNTKPNEEHDTHKDVKEDKEDHLKPTSEIKVGVAEGGHDEAKGKGHGNEWSEGTHHKPSDGFGSAENQRLKGIEKPDEAIKAHGAFVSSYMGHGGPMGGMGNGFNEMDMSHNDMDMSQQNDMPMGGMKYMPMGMSPMGMGRMGGMRGMGGMGGMGGMRGMGGMGGMGGMRGMGGMGGMGRMGQWGRMGEMGQMGMQPMNMNPMNTAMDMAMRQKLMQMQIPPGLKFPPSMQVKPFEYKGGAKDNDGSGEQQVQQSSEQVQIDGSNAAKAKEQDYQSGSGETQNTQEAGSTSKSASSNEKSVGGEDVSNNKGNTKIQKADKSEDEAPSPLARANYTQPMSHKITAGKPGIMPGITNNERVVPERGHVPDRIVDLQIDDFKDAVTVTVGQYKPHMSDDNTTYHDTVRNKVHEAPSKFCNGKNSGVYADSKDPSRFVICYNGVTEERKCAKGLVFNPREKICELPDKRKMVIRKGRRRNGRPNNDKDSTRVNIAKEKMTAFVKIAKRHKSPVKKSLLHAKKRKKHHEM